MELRSGCAHFARAFREKGNLIELSPGGGADLRGHTQRAAIASIANGRLCDHLEVL